MSIRVFFYLFEKISQDHVVHVADRQRFRRVLARVSEISHLVVQDLPDVVGLIELVLGEIPLERVEALLVILDRIKFHLMSQCLYIQSIKLSASNRANRQMSFTRL